MSICELRDDNYLLIYWYLELISYIDCYLILSSPLISNTYWSFLTDYNVNCSTFYFLLTNYPLNFYTNTLNYFTLLSLSSITNSISLTLSSLLLSLITDSLTSLNTDALLSLIADRLVIDPLVKLFSPYSFATY